MLRSRSARRFSACSNGKIPYPVLLVHPLVPELIHHVNGVASVLIYRVKQGNRILHRLQRGGHLTLGQLHGLGNFADLGLFSGTNGQLLPGPQGSVGGVPQGTG